MSSTLLLCSLKAVVFFLLGVFCTLLGFRRIGSPPGANHMDDTWHRWFGKHLRWIGPLITIGAIVMFAAELYAYRLVPWWS